MTTAARNGMKLNIEDVELGITAVTNLKDLVQRDGKYAILNPFTGTMESITKRNIYRTRNAKTKRIETAFIDDI